MDLSPSWSGEAEEEIEESNKLRNFFYKNNALDTNNAAGMHYFCGRIIAKPLDKRHMKGALFDLDGVIIDSETLYTEFWRDIDRHYPTGVPDFAIHIKGTTLATILPYFPDGEVQGYILRRLNEFQREMKYTVYPYAEEYLQSLKDAGIATALVTSSDEKKMQALFAQLPRLQGYFDAIIHAGCITHSKPHPEPYLKGAEALGLSASDCCVFEDSLQGLAAGRAAGAKVVALATTYPAERLQGLADLIIRDFNDASLSKL